MLHRVVFSGRGAQSPDDSFLGKRRTGAQLFDGAGAPSRASAARRLAPGEAGSQALNRLAELAARLLGAGSAQVSLLTDVQLVAAGAGQAVASVGLEGPLEESLCTVTAASGAPLLVGDAVTDERVRELPPVTSGDVGSYLGVPLVDDDGHTIGALCVFDPEPRTWSDSDMCARAATESSPSRCSGRWSR